jgi:hypothetical protein
MQPERRRELFPRNVGKFLSDYVTYHLRKQCSWNINVSQNFINQLISLLQTERVPCEVRTEFLNVI